MQCDFTTIFTTVLPRNVTLPQLYHNLYHSPTGSRLLPQPLPQARGSRPHTLRWLHIYFLRKRKDDSFFLWMNLIHHKYVAVRNFCCFFNRTAQCFYTTLTNGPKSTPKKSRSIARRLFPPTYQKTPHVKTAFFHKSYSIINSDIQSLTLNPAFSHSCFYPCSQPLTHRLSCGSAKSKIR